jgi:hypothetical protein
MQIKDYEFWAGIQSLLLLLLPGGNDRSSSLRNCACTKMRGAQRFILRLTRSVLTYTHVSLESPAPAQSAVISSGFGVCLFLAQIEYEHEGAKQAQQTRGKIVGTRAISADIETVFNLLSILVCFSVYQRQ